MPVVRGRCPLATRHLEECHCLSSVSTAYRSYPPQPVEAACRLFSLVGGIRFRRPCRWLPLFVCLFLVATPGRTHWVMRKDPLPCNPGTFFVVIDLVSKKVHAVDVVLDFVVLFSFQEFKYLSEWVLQQIVPLLPGIQHGDLVRDGVQQTSFVQYFFGSRHEVLHPFSQVRFIDVGHVRSYLFPLSSLDEIQDVLQMTGIHGLGTHVSTIPFEHIFQRVGKQSFVSFRHFNLFHEDVVPILLTHLHLVCSGNSASTLRTSIYSCRV